MLEQVSLDELGNLSDGVVFVGFFVSFVAQFGFGHLNRMCIVYSVSSSGTF